MPTDAIITLTDPRSAAAEGAETVKDGIAKVWPGQKAA